MKPTEDIAKSLIQKHYGVAPRSVHRFLTGLHHYVYDCAMDGSDSVVVRMTTPRERPAMEGALLLNLKLRPLGITLPEIYFHDLDFEFPYLVMERFPGRDIGYVLSTLSEESMDLIADALMTMQQIVGRTGASSKFGYAAKPQDAPFSVWTDELRSSLKRSRKRIELAGVIDTNYVADIESRLERLVPELDRQVATPFLHDITTKNVIVDGGRLSGIVDVDSLCYGDPLFQIGLTKMALLSDGTSLTYIDHLLRHYGDYSKERLALYASICCVDFMSEIGQTFNGLNGSFSPERKAHLEKIFTQLTNRSGTTVRN